jgi:hypothetical protein
MKDRALTQLPLQYEALENKLNFEQSSFNLEYVSKTLLRSIFSFGLRVFVNHDCCLFVI